MRGGRLIVNLRRLPGLLLVAILTAPAGAAELDTSFELINQSNMIIDAVQISPLNSDKWGRDWLGERMLRPGEKIRLNPGGEGGCLNDVRVIYRGNLVEERRRQDLCKLSDITFNGSGAVPRQQAQGTQQPQQGQQGGQAQQQTPIADFSVVNSSPKVMAEVYVSPSDQDKWGEDRLPGTLNPGGKFLVRLPRNGVCVYDVRVVYEDKTSEERRRQDLCKVNDLAFNAQGARPPTTAGGGGGQQAQTPTPPKPPAGGSFGTGFFVTAQGHALTNNHVVNECRSVGALIDGQFIPASIVRRDERNDLALVRVQVPQQVPYAKFRGGGMARPGDGVVVAGYPLPSVLQNGLNVTLGNVSSLAGLGGNTSLVQITAPVQPGNSGGPLFDMQGAIIGVVVSKLNAMRIAQATGDIPQNINYAVHGSVARLFVESTGQRTTELASGKEMRASEVGDIAQQFTIQLECRN